MKEITFSRRELYDLVWSESLMSLAKQYDISDVGLRKVCIRMNIPLPGLGYWNKILAGKKVDVKPFPETHSGDKEIKLWPRNAGPNVDGYGMSPQQVLKNAIEGDPLLNLNVPKVLVDPDPLIVDAHKSLSKKNEHYMAGDLRSSGFGMLNISVMPELIVRALCIMDTFIKAMRHRGHDFVFKDQISCLLIGGEEMKMTLKEKVNQEYNRDKATTKVDYFSTGILTLKFERFNNTITCNDGKVPIEEQLSKVISKLELLGETFKKERAANEKWRTEFEEKRRAEKEYANRKEMELKSFKQILEDSRRWKEVVLLREYIDRIEEEAKRNGRLTDDIAEWLNWARKKADWFDPLLEVEDEWLKGVAPNDLLAHHPEQPKSTSYGSSNSGIEQSKRYWPGMPWYLRK